MSKLTPEFYKRTDVVQITKELLGKYIFTNINGELTGGIITEAEAYAGIIDRASHAWNNRRTKRTETMYMEGGVAYVYLCYGIHSMFNIVTNKKDIPHAILIREVKPTTGTGIILKRRGKTKLTDEICSGPGSVTQGLGIKTSHDKTDLTGKLIWLEDQGTKIKEKEIMSGPRVGVDYAGEDASLPYRFWIGI